MTGLLVLLAVLAAVGLLTLWWRWRDGQMRATGGRFSPTELARLGVPPGVAALVEFTAPSCAPCTAARRVLVEVAAGYEDMTVVGVDVGDAPDLARAHRVVHAPTTLMVARDGRVRGRVAGVPRSADVAGLLGSIHEPGRALGGEQFDEAR